MNQQTILLLSASAGAGHVRAAEALRCCAATRPGVKAIHLDALRWVTPGLRRVYTDGYLYLVRRAPILWRLVYQLTNRASSGGWAYRLRRWIQHRASGALIREIATLNPDIIICTHFLPAEILSRLVAAGRVQCPVWVQVTDFDLHRMWVLEHMTGYFAPNDEVAFRMRNEGISPDAIRVTGIPIMSAFSRKPDRNACARELGIAPGRPTLLLMGGGGGLGNLAEVAEHLLGIQDNIQLIALAGTNRAALSDLQDVARRYPGRLWAQGHTDKIERLMACADLAVTKPGGLTSAECLAMGLPMIVNSPIPGQEDANANYLIEQGVAFKASDLATLEYRIRYLLSHPEKLHEMRQKAVALSRPDAALRAIDRAFGDGER